MHTYPWYISSIHYLLSDMKQFPYPIFRTIVTILLLHGKKTIFIGTTVFYNYPIHFKLIASLQFFNIPLELISCFPLGIEENYSLLSHALLK